MKEKTIKLLQELENLSTSDGRKKIKDKLNPTLTRQEDLATLSKVMKFLGFLGLGIGIFYLYIFIRNFI